MITFKLWDVVERKMHYTDLNRCEIVLLLECKRNRRLLSMRWELHPKRVTCYAKNPKRMIKKIDLVYEQGFELMNPIDNMFSQYSFTDQEIDDIRASFRGDGINLEGNWWENKKRDVIVRIMGYKEYTRFVSRRVADELEDEA